MYPRGYRTVGAEVVGQTPTPRRFAQAPLPHDCNQVVSTRMKLTVISRSVYDHRMNTKIFTSIAVFAFVSICIAQAQSPSPAESPSPSQTPAKHLATKKAKATPAPATHPTPSPSPGKFNLGDLFKPKSSAGTGPAASSSSPARGAAANAPTTNSPAPGGGHGLVWVNTETHVYHREGSRFYGTTKKGKYMTEADAIKEGNKAAGAQH